MFEFNCYNGNIDDSFNVQVELCRNAGQPYNSLVKVRLNPKICDNKHKPEPDDYIRTVNGYTHGETVLSISTSYPFNDPFDSYPAGYIWMSKEEYDQLEDKNKAEEIMENYLKEYTAYINGDVFEVTGNDTFDIVYGIDNLRKYLKENFDYNLKDGDINEIYDI